MKTIVVLFACGLAGCALTSKSEPVPRRFFTAEIARTTSATDAAQAPRLRLGRVSAAASLRQPRIVYRRSRFELGEYDDQRWSDDPEAYARRALARTLFAEGHFRQAASGPAPVLDVELVAFEEIRDPEHGGAVEMIYTLTEGPDVLTSGRVRVERPAHGASMEAIVAAIAAALDAVVEDVAHRVQVAVDARSR